MTPYLNFEATESLSKDASGTGWFARKVFRAKLDDEKLKHFRREVQSLERIKNVGHPHLMKYHKAFIHGGVGVIIFPLASSDLRKQLLQPRDTLGPGGVRSHAFWDQLLGVSRALAKMHSFNVPDAQRENIIFFYHFDLKPANILVGIDGTFIISDFGQAHFLRPENGAYVDSSIAEDCSGDPSYAPPENDSSHLVDGKHLEKSRKYDTWCLGCIFLEVLWYVVKGCRGSEELDCLRNFNSPNDYFYYLDQNGAHLKNDLKDKTTKLSSMADWAVDQDFIGRMVNLIFEMLNTNPRQRFTAEEVVHQLSHILDSRAPIDLGTRLSDINTEPRSDGFITSNTQSSFPCRLRWTRNGESYQGDLSIKRQGQKLSGKFIRSQNSETIDMGELHTLLLVPFFALYRSCHLHTFPESDIVIVPKSYNTGKEYADRFQTFSQEGSLRLLEDLLGQKIVYHEELISASFKFSKGAQLDEARLPDQEMAGAVQIWVDPRAGLPRASWHSYPEPPARRLVIYMYKSIFLFRFASNFEMKIQTGNPEVLEWVPKRESGPPFHGLVLERSRDQPGPCIPMDEASLEKQTTKCSLIRLTFKTPKDRYFFGEKYFKEKAEWRREKDGYRNHWSRIAEERGLEYLS